MPNTRENDCSPAVNFADCEYTFVRGCVATLPQAASTGADDVADHTIDSEEFTPGFLRWGRLAGCDFCFGNPKNWPEEYLCNEDNTAGCTPDHRMSARCSLNNWGGYADNPQVASPVLYEPPLVGNSWQARTPAQIGSVTYAGNLPDTFNYLNDLDPADGVTGGYSDANEFAPVMVRESALVTASLSPECSQA